MFDEMWRGQPGARPMSPEAADDPLFVRTVGRAFDLLDAFHRASGPLSLTDLAKAAGIDRSAAQRIVHTLRQLGYIRRDDRDTGYLPGIRLLDQSFHYLRLDPLVARATPVLLELRRAVRERVDLSLFDDLRMVYAIRLQSKREYFPATLVGHSVPTFCTSGGWAVLSRLAETEADDILARSDHRAFTPSTLREPDRIKAEIAAARTRGYALALEQVQMGEIAIGVPIRGSKGRPVAAIHIAGSLAEWEPDAFARRFAPLAEEAARAIERP